MKDLALTGTSAKFRDPELTADGQRRAHVAPARLSTVWFNTGTLCNIECATCYIDSSPTNDALIYLTAAEVQSYLGEIAEARLPVGEIGFTGGEPFLNPDILTMAGAALDRGLRVLILTNAMRPMMRPPIMAGLIDLLDAHGDRLTLRVSLDHYSSAHHDQERGKGSFERTLEGMRWLAGAGFTMTVAGRSKWGETQEQARAGFAGLFAREGFNIDATHPAQTVLFPEMDGKTDVPEITTACWGILDKSPDSVMCADSRMVVHRKGEARATVTACTLLPFEPDFDLGPTLAGSLRPVSLNHPHCAKFCVLGGASCAG
ncbi:radical SAM protein [Chachezhania sediminis]|uniref:radical SAM protein n=1 Tax=Chachezhania sediminis TaxID=2599291 RepID=UPI00131BADB1|nr:radical SAM protein [Chachezhania sediminis]